MRAPVTGLREVGTSPHAMTDAPFASRLLPRAAGVLLAGLLALAGVQCLGDLANIFKPPAVAVTFRFSIPQDSLKIEVGTLDTIPAVLRVGQDSSSVPFRALVQLVRGNAAELVFDTAALQVRPLKWGRWVVRVSAASSRLPADTLPWDTVVVRATIPRVVLDTATLRDTLLTSFQREGQLSAHGETAGGQRIENAPIAWRMSGTSSAVTLVNPTGRVKAGTVDGSATLEAFVNDSGASSGVRAQKVWVRQMPWTLAISPAQRALHAVGQQVTLTASVQDSLGSAMTTATVQWTTGAAGVATVASGTSLTGVVTASGDGTAVITASAPDAVRGGSHQRTAQVTVERAQLAAVSSATASGTVNTALASPLEVRLVRVADGSAVADSGIRAVFATSGSAAFVRTGLAVDTELTDNLGHARAAYRLGTVATQYTVNVTGPGLVGSPVGFTATATPGAASALAFTAQPSDRTAGDTLSVGVSARDAFGNGVVSYANPIRLSLGSAPAGASLLAGDSVVTPVAGVALFTGLRLGRAGPGYTFRAASARAPGDTIGGTSGTFAVAAGPGATLAFTSLPASVAAGDSLGFSVTVRDAFGNTATSYGDSVTVALGANPGGATLGGATARKASGGIASFADLNLDKVGTGYTLVASSGTLTPVASSLFNITPAAPKRLAFTVAPASAVAGAAFSVTVAAHDRYDSVATGFADSMTLALGSGPTGAALLGTLRQKATSGVAVFPGLALRTAGGNYTLTASAAGLTGATTAAFAASPAAASALVGVSGDLQTDSAGVTLPAPFVVEVRDAYGNTVASQPVTFVVAAGGGKLAGQDSLVVPTGAQGRSSVTLTLGTTRDTNRVTASIVGLVTPVAFRAFALTRVAAVAVSPHTSTLYSLPDSVRLAATARDAAGVVIPSVAFTWQSTNTNVATVSAAGMVTARAGGTAYVRATTAGASDSALVTVQAATDFSCTSPGGTTHGGTVSASDTWTKSGSPHFVTSSLTVQGPAVLTIQPGALVCLSSGVRLTVQGGGRLIARGAVAPNAIGLRATNAAQPWGGMIFSGAPGDSSYLVNVVIENTTGGTFSNYAAVRSQDTHFLVLDSTVVRGARRAGVELLAPGSRISRSLVESAGVDATSPGVVLGNSTQFVQTTVRGSSGAGVQVTGTGNGVRLMGGRVEMSGGIGLDLAAATLAAASPVRVTAGASYPLQAPIQTLALLAPTAASQDSLRGNALDTLVVVGGTLTSSLTVGSSLPWRVTGNVTVDAGGLLTLGAGSHVASIASVSFTFQNGGRLSARGSAAAPAVFTATNPATPWTGLSVQGSPADSSYLVNARVEFASGAIGFSVPAGYEYYAVGAMGQHPLVIDSTTIRQCAGGVALSSAGSRISRSRVDTTTTYSAVYLSGAVTFEATTVRLSKSYGIYVTGALARVLGGRLEGSTREGIYAASGPLAAVQPLRVTSGASYAVHVMLSDLARLAPTAAAQDSLLGNLRDTLVVTGGSLLVTSQTVRADVPWRFEGSASFDSGSVLTVQPGAGVVAASGVRLTFRNSGRLVAVGTSAAPVRFTSTGSTATWSGLFFQGRTGVYLGGMPRDTSRLVNARVEYAAQTMNAAIHSQDKHVVLIDSSVIRQSGYGAVYLGAPQSRISRSTIDTSGTLGSGSGVALGDSTFLDSVTVRKPSGAGLAISGSSVTVTGVTVTGSGQQGIYGSGSGSAVRLLGGSILNSTGTGIDVAGSTLTLSQVTPFTVTGGASYPLRVSAAQYRLFLPDSASRAAYAGNAKDTVLITSGTLAGYPSLVLTPAAPVRFEGSVTFDSGTVVTVRPGFVFRMASGQGFTFQNGSRLVARGTAALPIQFVPDNAANPWGTLSFQGTPPDSSYLTNVRLERGASYGYTVDAASTHPVVMDTVLVRQARSDAVRLNAPGSRFSRSTIDTTGRDNSGVVTYAGVGLALGANTKVESSVVRNTGGIGVDVNGSGVRLLGTRVLASGDVGLDARDGAIADFTGSRVQSGASYPVYASIQALPLLLSDSLLGNARDTLRVSGGTLKGAQVVVGTGLPWRVDGYVYVDSAAVLSVQPGGRVAVASGQTLFFNNGGRLVARGTAGSPVVFTAANPAQPWGGLVFQGGRADSSYLVNARLEYSGGYSSSYNSAAVVAWDSTRVVLDSTVVRQSASGLYLAGSGWRVSRSRVDTTTSASYAAVYLGATGKWEANRVRGGASYPLRAASLQYLTGLVVADQDSLLGNARDTLAVSGGTLKAGQVTVGAGVPWRVEGYVYVDSAAVMTVQPGGRVAVASSQSLLFQNGGRLVARGTAAAPAVFTATNPAQPWGGLVFQGSPADSSYLVNARVEYSGGYSSSYNNAAVATLSQHRVVLDSAVVRQSAGALYLAGPGWRVSRSRVDTTTNGSYAAVYLNATGKWEANRVRGSASYAMRTTAENLASLTANPAYADSLMGNARDTLVVTGGTLKAVQVAVTPALPWRVEGYVYVDSAAVLVAQPGARVAAGSGVPLVFQSGGRLVARGTAAAPVVFTAVNPAQSWGGLVFQGSPADSSYLVNARVEYGDNQTYWAGGYTRAALVAVDQHRVVLDSAVVRQSASGLYLGAPGWRVSRSRVDTTTNGSYAAVYLNATGKWETSRVRGGASYPLRAGSLQYLTALAAADQDSLLGNARDTLVVNGGTLKPGQVTVGAALPWRVEGYVYVDSAGLLTVQPGGRVTVTQTQRLYFQSGGRLVARGTAAAPVVFTAVNPAQPWGGLVFQGSPADSSYLVDARIEYASGYGNYAAVSAMDQHRVVLDSAVVRQSASGLYLTAPGWRVSRSRVDTTTSASYAAVYLGATGKWEANRVRGSASYPLQTGSVQYLTGLAASDQDSLLGNAKDTLEVTGGTLRAATLTVRAALPWRVESYLYVDSAAVLAVQPGGRLAMTSGQVLMFQNGGRLAARGTAAAPAVFTAANSAQPWGALVFYGSPADSSYLVNARVEYSGGYAGGYDYAAVEGGSSTHLVVVDSSEIRQSATGVYLAAAGSRVSRSHVDTTTNTGYAAVHFAASGKFEASYIRGAARWGLYVGAANVTVSYCDISGTLYDGIYITSGSGVTIHNCNLVSNGGYGINNTSGTLVDATSNWWGDAAGPNGTNGDGVMGSVTWNPPLGAKVTIPQ